MKPLPENPRWPIWIYIESTHFYWAARFRILMPNGECYWDGGNDWNYFFKSSCFAVYSFTGKWKFKTAKQTLKAMRKWDEKDFKVIEWGYIK